MLAEPQRNKEVKAIEAGFTAELLGYSHPIIKTTSIWNRDGLFPRAVGIDQMLKNFPRFIEPMYFPANVGKIGQIRQPWAAMAIITFYYNLREINDLSKELNEYILEMHKLTNGVPEENLPPEMPPFPEVSEDDFQGRLWIMATNLAHALDGLNDDKPFPIPADLRLDQLFAPAKTPLSETKPRRCGRI